MTQDNATVYLFSAAQPQRPRLSFKMCALHPLLPVGRGIKEVTPTAVHPYCNLRSRAGTLTPAAAVTGFARRCNASRLPAFCPNCMFTPGNTLVVAFLLLSAYGLVCSSYTSSWCRAGVSISTGMIGLLGAGVITLIDRTKTLNPSHRTWRARWHQLRRFWGRYSLTYSSYDMSRALSQARAQVEHITLQPSLTRVLRRHAPATSSLRERQQNAVDVPDIHQSTVEVDGTRFARPGYATILHNDLQRRGCLDTLRWVRLTLGAVLLNCKDVLA
ncbi:hypothetical protein EXIGLDRAFT_483147 [Exidia glandulosa HHB12029]|uniref:Uncharacterized protein n=1 Tax=Exidia glandulosa HHB12029 TaxID=1314781 RepID=A0A165PID7_EXIGL|nr:hypothetical protein EXIGLDRAFT_483147 [Exidia glandulosa HHB12029]